MTSPCALPMELLPAYAGNLTDGFRKFCAFLWDTRFPELARFPVFAKHQDPLAAYQASGNQNGLATWIAAEITAAHTSKAFDAHAAKLSAGASKERIPRLRSLVPHPLLPEPGACVAQLQEALATAFITLPPDRLDGAMHALLALDLFPEAMGGGNLTDWLEGFFRQQRAAAMIVLERRDAPGGIGPERQLLLDVAIRHYRQVRYFERSHKLLGRAVAATEPGRDVDPRYIEHLWYAAFRLGRATEARDWLEEWARMRPQQKQPLVNLAVVKAYDDKAEAMLLLEHSGALTGQSTVPGNVLYAEYSLQLGAIHQAASCIGRACEITRAEGQPLPMDYLITLHNICVARGAQSNLLYKFFERSSINLSSERFSIDTVVDHTVAPEAPPARVAVVMTAYNAQAYLARAIAGVLGQSVTGLHLIVVDDCSEDGTAAVCAPYAESGALTYLKTPHNIGTYGAKNLGIRHALKTGCDYVALCDADDFWLRSHVAHHLREMAGRPEIKCSTSQWMRVCSDGTIECGMLGRYVDSCPHSTFFSADVFAQVGFFDPVRFGADREFFHRLQLHYGPDSTLEINTILTLGRRHALSLTQSGAGAISEFSESPHRMVYCKGWNEWHDAELAAGRLPVLDGTLESRPFEVPDEMRPSPSRRA